MELKIDQYVIKEQPKNKTDLKLMGNEAHSLYGI